MRSYLLYLTISALIVSTGLSCVSQQQSIAHVQPEDIQLSTPRARFNSSLFVDKMQLQFQLDYPDSDIYYTVDGSKPSNRSILCKDQVLISSSCVIRAIAMHHDHKSSEEVKLEFIKANQLTSFKSASLSRQPSESYPGGGAASLFDLNKGSINFSESAWMGFNGGSVSIDVDLNAAEDINSVKISTLSNPGAWIFLPEQIKILIDGRTYQTTIEIPTEAPKASQYYINIPIDAVQTDKFTIELTAVSELPDWHQGAGGPAWMFIDEVLVN